VRQETLHSELAQKSVLGSALLANGMLRGPLAELAISDFVGSDHQQIFSTMVTLDSEGLPFDAGLLADRLPDKMATLGDLIDHATEVPAIAAQHAATIRTFSKRRRLRAFAHTLERNVQMEDNPDIVLEQAEEMLDRLRNGFDLTGEMLPYVPANGHRRPELRQLSAVESRAVDWLWRPYLGFGMLAMLRGDPGAGKSYIAMAISAALTTGGTPRTYEPLLPLDVLYLTIENSPEPCFETALRSAWR
jgi:replicative DNA helicase